MRALMSGDWMNYIIGLGMFLRAGIRDTLL
jgi:hypothetical protein